MLMFDVRIFQSTQAAMITNNVTLKFCMSIPRQIQDVVVLRNNPGTTPKVSSPAAPRETSGSHLKEGWIKRHQLKSETRNEKLKKYPYIVVDFFQSLYIVYKRFLIGYVLKIHSV